MKTTALLAALALLTFSGGGNALAYEGGTKMIAAALNPESKGIPLTQISVVSSDQLTPSKPVVGFLHRVPEPTLSVTRLREEVPGKSLGTKAVVLFQRGK